MESTFNGEGAEQLDTVDLEEIFASLTDENCIIIFEDGDEFDDGDDYSDDPEWN